MEEDESAQRQTEGLNWLGKTVFWGGKTVHTAARLIDAAARQAADVAGEARQAFQEGLNDEVEDAKIIGEWKESESRGKGE